MLERIGSRASRFVPMLSFVATTQLARQECLSARREALKVRGVGEAMSLVLEEQILNGNSIRAQRRYNLIALLLLDAGIVCSLRNEQRRAHRRRFEEWRWRLEELRIFAKRGVRRSEGPTMSTPQVNASGVHASVVSTAQPP